MLWNVLITDKKRKRSRARESHGVVLPGWDYKVFVFDVWFWQFHSQYWRQRVCGKYAERTLHTGCWYVVGLQWLIDYTRTHLMALCPGLPRWAGTRKVKPIWMLLKQETVTGSGCFLTYLLPYLSFPLRIDPLRFQAGCCKRRLNLALVFLC